MPQAQYVSKSRAKEMRAEMPALFKAVKTQLKQEMGISFQERIVGSAKRNMIVQFGDSIFDTDYELVFLGEKNKQVEVSVKKKLYEIFEEIFKKNKMKNWHIEISTSVLTINKLERGVLVHSFDLAITKLNSVGKTIKVAGKVDGQYYWNETENNAIAYKLWKENYKDLKKSVRIIYLDKRSERHDKIKDNKNNPLYKSSSSLFVESVMEAYQKRNTPKNNNENKK